MTRMNREFTLVLLGAGAGALVDSFSLLVATRVVQGVGAGLVSPAALAAAVSGFPPERRGSALGVWGASAGVANRQPVIQITDGAGHVLHNSPFSGVQAASLTEQYSAGESEPIANNGNFNITSLPRGCKMLQGWTIGTSTVAIQAADQWSLIWLMVMEWLEL